MSPEAHRRKAERIERSLAKCARKDYEAVIEAAMLAGSHWFNMALHVFGLTAEDDDVVHTYFLTGNQSQRYGILAGDMLAALDAIEQLRPLYVRGNAPGGEAAGRRAFELLARIRESARAAKPAV